MAIINNLGLRMTSPTELNEIDGLRVNTALRFYHEILGLDALHYGLWENDAFNMEGLKTAQERYTDHLIAYFPDNVKTVLDVGAGTGATSEKLKKLGVKDTPKLDDTIKEVCSDMGSKNRNKYRVIFYYLLVKKLKKSKVFA